MGRLGSGAGMRARLQVNSLEDRCVPSAVLGDPKWVQSISINDGAQSWESVTSIEVEFARPLAVEPSRAVHIYKSELGGLLWTEVSIPNMEVSAGRNGNTVIRVIGPSAGDAIVVDGDYKIVLTPTQYSLPIMLGSFAGIDLGDGDGDDGEWH